MPIILSYLEFPIYSFVRLIIILLHDKKSNSPHKGRHKNQPVLIRFSFLF